MSRQDWIQLVSVATNLSIVVVGIKIVRHLSRMEFKVEMMWSEFKHKLHLDGSE